MTSQPRASLANARNVPRHFDRRFAVVLARRHAITMLTWITTGGDHRQWQWLPDGLVSILRFRYGLNAVHVDSRRAHVHRANIFERTTWPRKQRRQRKPRRQPPRRWQRRLPRKRSNLVYDEQIAAPGSPRGKRDRRECLDHMIVFREAHLRRILRGYAAYYADMPPIIMCRGLIDL
jgi:hypothetical protein